MRTHTLLVGAHMSVAGGLACAIEQAAACGFNCVQLFTHSPRVWDAPAPSPDDCARFRAARRAHGLRFVMVHAPYLPNPASPDDRLWRTSIDVIRRDLNTSDAIEADAYVIHPGSTKGGRPGSGIQRVRDALLRVCDGGVPRAQFLLETTSGAGSMLGGRMDELAAIISSTQERAPELRMGICIDTAHVFAAGCDVRQERGVAHLLAELKRTLGVAALRAIHANDSLHEHGTRRDQHAHIGSGCIGTAGFRHLMRVSAFRRVPWILETPKDDDGADVRNRKALERLFRATAPPAPGSS